MNSLIKNKSNTKSKNNTQEINQIFRNGTIQRLIKKKKKELGHFLQKLKPVTGKNKINQWPKEIPHKPIESNSKAIAFFKKNVK